MKHSLTNFTGMFPRYQHFLIPDTAAQTIVDGNIVSGGLEAFRTDLIVQDLNKIYKDFYRYYRTRDHGQWLFFDTPVDVANSSVFDDITNQSYVSGLDKFRVFDTNTLKSSDTTVTPKNSYVAGIIPPSMPPRLTVHSEGSGAQETRAYAMAYARQWRSMTTDLGEISMPAVDVNGNNFIDCKTDSVIKIDNIALLSDSLDRGISHVYIYRTAVTSKGVTAYRYVDSFPIREGDTIPPTVQITGVGPSRTFTYTDSIKTENLGEEAINLGWTAPPDDLRGIISMKNGVLAGFKDNTIYLSEPYQNHVFPSAYVNPLDYTIVGLGAFGNTLVVFTEAYTYLVVVNDPAAALLVPIQEAYPCVSKESIVSLDSACLYATNFGLMKVTANGATLITKAIITDKEWLKLNPSTIKAGKYQDKYMMFWKSNKLKMNGYLFDFQETTKTGILGISQVVHSLYSDPVKGLMYIMYNLNVDDTPILAAFGESPSARRAYKWVSKKFLNNEGLFTLSAGKVNFYLDNYKIDNEPFIYRPSFHGFNMPVINTYAINGDSNTALKIRKEYGDQWCILSVYVDDEVKKTVYVLDNTPFRLPAGFRGDSFYIEITSTVPIARVQVASSIGELE